MKIIINRNLASMVRSVVRWYVEEYFCYMEILFSGAYVWFKIFFIVVKSSLLLLRIYIHLVNSYFVRCMKHSFHFLGSLAHSCFPFSDGSSFLIVTAFKACLMPRSPGHAGTLTSSEGRYSLWTDCT